MRRKILYSLGVIFGLFILLPLLVSKPEPGKGTAATVLPAAVEQTTQKSLPIEATSESTNGSTTTSESAKTPLPKVPTSSPSIITYYPVLSVVDGDTVKIRMNGKEETIRLIGVDTPETVDPRKSVQCFGREASNKAKELLSGKKVRIEMDSSQGERDKYDRLLAYLYRDDGIFYNRYMIEQGYAHEYTYNIPYKYQAEFKAAQKAAQAAHVGLWSPTTCNGDTTSQLLTPTPTAAVSEQASGKFYTSSYHTSKYYYPASCDGWKSLSPSYLKAFDSLEALFAVYPSREKSPQCQ